MKWQARKPVREAVMEWHSRFALVPRLIPEQKADSIVVPKHWLWLERYETRRYLSHHEYEWQRRSYTGEPSLRKVRRK